jgi:replicative DNA helicase
MGLISDSDFAQRKQQLEDVAAARAADAMSEQRQAAEGLDIIQPLAAAVEGVLEAMEGGHNRITTGLAELDVLTRGFGPKELVYVTGFSHAGKTQLMNTMIYNNRDKRILFFSLDDPAEMILIKLACMYEGVSADVFEQRLREGDEGAKRTLKEVALGTYSNLVVVDESIGFRRMSEGVREAEQYWGAPPDAVIIDYLGLVPDDNDGGDAYAGIARRSQQLKRWVKNRPFPTICVHQGTRSYARPGQALTLLSMAYGGEQEGTMVIGVRRRRDDESLDGWEREKHANTVTIHLLKNKRPPSKTTKQGGLDLWLDPDTGLIRPLRDSDYEQRNTNIR